MAVVFALCTLVQFNDPDPLPWLFIYGGAFSVAVWALGGSVPRPLLLLLAVVAPCWAALLLSAAWASTEPLSLAAVVGSIAMKNDRVELVREIGGLVIVSAYMLSASSLR